MPCPTRLSNTAFAFFSPLTCSAHFSILHLRSVSNVHPVQSLTVTACAANRQTAILVTDCIMFNASTSNCALPPE